MGASVNKRTPLGGVSVCVTKTNAIMKILSLIVLLVLIAPVKVCVGKKPRIHNSELEKNVLLWRDKKISNYNFTIRKTTMGTWSILPMFIKVREGKPIAKGVIGEQGPMTLVDDFDDYSTMEQAFATIQDAYDNEYFVDVRYNSEFGYPENFRTDLMRATDQLVIYDITGFEVIHSEIGH